MPESPEDQRTRILATITDVDPVDYDLAVALGYAPESWDGMWKLAAENAFTFRHGCVIARERISGTEQKPWHDRLVAHRLPEGWQVIEDMAETEPRISFVSPRSLA